MARKNWRMAKMIVKKFKNNKLKLEIEKSDYFYFGHGGELQDTLYFEEIEGSDLYINQINGYQYLVDFNKNVVYEMGSYLLQNPLKYLLDELEEKKRIYFYPLSKKHSRSLLQDLENGY
jgi:hypothetical protein